MTYNVKLWYILWSKTKLVKWIVSDNWRGAYFILKGIKTWREEGGDPCGYWLPVRNNSKWKDFRQNVLRILKEKVEGYYTWNSQWGEYGKRMIRDVSGSESHSILQDVNNFGICSEWSGKLSDDFKQKGNMILQKTCKNDIPITHVYLHCFPWCLH